MIVTRESSMKIYNEMAANIPEVEEVPVKPHHVDPYKRTGKRPVSVVKTGDREQGIRKAIELIGGIKPLVEDVNGPILIKPNCNTDDPYPRDTHHQTVKTLATLLIENGVEADHITVGDMSGRGRGLPTRATMENLGITKVADELGVNVSYFEEEEWVKLKPEKLTHWPEGLRIPRTVYEAERIIFTPILRCHSTATFTCSMKLGVGLIDADERNWLHNGIDFYEKMIDINLAYQVDLVVADAMKMNTGLRTDPKDEVTPGIITASSNMVVSDAVSYGFMKYYNTARVREHKALEHIQFRLAERLGLGSPNLTDMEFMSYNYLEDDEFEKVIEHIITELT